MPRLPRVHIDGSLYYVTCQSHHSNELFKDSQDYEKYLSLLANYKNKYHFKLFSYCLLSSQVYLLIGVNSKSSISEIMFNLNSSYTKYYNAIHGSKGPVLQGRFKSKWVEKKTYLLPLTRYIHLLSKDSLYTSYPVFSRPQIGGQVSKPSQIFMKDEIDETLSFLPQGTDYKTYVEKIDLQEFKNLGRKLSRNRVLGSVEFQEKVKAAVKDYQTNADKRHKIKAKKEKLVLEKRMPIHLPRWKLSKTFGGASNFKWNFLRGLVFQSAVLSVLILFTIAGYFYVKQFSLNKAGEVKITKESENIVGVNNTQSQPNLPTIIIEEKASIPKEGFPVKEIKPVSEPLENIAWEIKLQPVSLTNSPKTQFDVLTFKEGKFVSNILTKEGAAPSRYSVRYKSEGVIVWETMQTKEDGTTVNWYGEYNGDIMKGVLSQVPADGKSREFSFVSVGYRKG